MNNIAIKVDNLSKHYKIYGRPIDRLKESLFPFGKKYHRDFYALDNISFEIKKGETVGILGKNGAGKSTLLKIITGVLTPTQGKLEINGKISALLELGAGFNPEFTGIQNIILSGTMLGFSQDEMRIKMKDIIEFADIGEFIDQPVKTYSSGMFARLAFSVAIHVDPDILIVDEALSVGDIFFQQKCNLYMKEKMDQKTKILVAHSIPAITAMADKVIVLDRGKIIFIGNTLDGVELFTKLMQSEVFGIQKNENNNKKEIEQEENLTDIDQEIVIDESRLGGRKEFIISSYHLKVNDKNYKGYVEAGDILKFSFEIQAKKKSDNLIFGYLCKDEFGNSIFGENTLTSMNIHYIINDVGNYKCELAFEWPEVKPQHYFITLGIGEGVHEFDHIIQCWLHNIIEVVSISPRKTIHAIINNKITNFDILS